MRAHMGNERTGREAKGQRVNEAPSLPGWDCPAAVLPCRREAKPLSGHLVGTREVPCGRGLPAAFQARSGGTGCGVPEKVAKVMPGRPGPLKECVRLGVGVRGDRAVLTAAGGHGLPLCGQG